MPDYCPMSDVPTSSCAHCRGLDDEPGRTHTRGTRSAPFRAAFPGTCRGTCGFDIKVGERVAYTGDMLAHVGCTDA